MKRMITSSSIYDEIADVTIKKTFDDFDREDYKIYYSNGNYTTYVNNFRLAAIRAKSY